MLETWVFLLIGFLCLMILGLVALVAYLALQMNKRWQNFSSLQMVKNSRLQAIKEQAEEVEKNRAYCSLHSNEVAKGMCSICQEAFCENCLRDQEGMNFCSSHLGLFLAHQWVAVEEVKTTPETPETALPVYRFKRKIWSDKGVPAIISTHYKINLEGDDIESYVKLLVREEEAENLRNQFRQYKQ